jgi:hypothetical protein
MGKLSFGMMQSLDGYIAGTPRGPQLPPPGPKLHRHFHMYEVMCYWDDNRPEGERSSMTLRLVGAPSQSGSLRDL